MYQNLQAEMVRANVTKSEMARVMGKSLKSLWNRFNGQTPFTIPEAFAIRDRFFSDMSLDYLFRDGNSSDTLARPPPREVRAGAKKPRSWGEALTGAEEREVRP